MFMDIFCEVKTIFCILCFIILFATFQVEASAKLIDCFKFDECSCKTNTVPQEEISLWPIPRGNPIHSQDNEWLFDINLCHGLSRNTKAPSGGCQNSTVCQYLESNWKSTFEIGRFGTVKFGQYNRETKSITLQYHGSRQENVTRSINITLQCDERGTVTKADYDMVEQSIFGDPTFTTKIKTKAACLHPSSIPTSQTTLPTTRPSKSPTTRPNTSPVKTPTTSPKPTVPKTKTTPATIPTTSPRTKSSKPVRSTPQTTTPNTSSTAKTKVTPTKKPSVLPTTSSGTSSSSVTSSGGLKAVYIVLIAVAGFIILLAVGVYVAYKIFKKRRRGLLIDEEESEDNGFLPQIQIQNALS